MPQSLASILIHVVFSTKNRVRWIHETIQPDLHAYMAGVCTQSGCPALCVGGTDDHVHILCALSRTVTVAALVEEIKTAASKWLKAKGPRYATFHWQDGYAAFSIGRSGEEAARKYIADQKNHHAKTSFQSELRTFLKKYDLNYDERYLWD